MRIKKEISRAIIPSIIVYGDSCCGNKCPFLKGDKKTECLLFHTVLDKSKSKDHRNERCSNCIEAFGK